jgi:hypothetical protein
MFHGRSTVTLPSDEQRQARVVRELIHAAGGVEACERDCGKAKSLFSGYQSPHDSRSIPLRDIEILESVTHGKLGHPHVTRYLARQAGYILLRRPDVPHDRADVMRLLARQARERGEREQQILDALGDGALDEAEAELLIPLFRLSLETTAEMLAELEAIVGRSS